MLNNGQGQNQQESTYMRSPQAQDPKVSLNDELKTSPKEAIKKVVINDEWNNN